MCVKFSLFLGNNRVHTGHWKPVTGSHGIDEFWVTETRVEVWENEKFCGSTSREANISTTFKSSPKLYNSMET